MAFGYGGFFGLSSTEYRSRLANASIKDLKQQEIVKMRTRIAAGLTAYLGLLSLVPTYGGSSVISAVQLRRLRVAHRKLELIREELTRRGVDLHELRKRDIAIPATGIAVGTGIGMGLEFGLGSFISAGDLFIGGPNTTSEEMDASFTERLHAILAHPEKLYEGFSAGFHEEGDLASAGAHGIGGLHGTENTAELAVHVLASDLHNPDVGSLMSDTSVPGPTSADGMIAEVAGEKLGLAAALALEKTAADIVTDQLTVWILEASETHQGCSRTFGFFSLSCDGCSKMIEKGTYMHCCKCDGDDFDLCNSCFKQGRRCKCRDSSGLHPLQVAHSGMLYFSQHTNELRRFQRAGAIGCDGCKTVIRQGRYYACLECNEHSGGFDLCPACFGSGKTCLSAKEHSLYTFMWARSPGIKALNPYEAELGHGLAFCDECSKPVRQGMFFHCASCKAVPPLTGEFDLCYRCYMKTGGCSRKGHELLRYNAFGARSVTSVGSSATCDVAGCKRILKNEGGYYSCKVCSIKVGASHRICHSCYGAGAGCLDSEHILTKIVDAD